MSTPENKLEKPGQPGKSGPAATPPPQRRSGIDRRWIKAPYAGPERRLGTDRRGSGGAGPDRTVGYRFKIETAPRRSSKEKQDDNQPGHAQSPTEPDFFRSAFSKIPYKNHPRKMEPVPLAKRA